MQLFQVVVVVVVVTSIADVKRSLHYNSSLPPPPLLWRLSWVEEEIGTSIATSYEGREGG